MSATDLTSKLYRSLYSTVIYPAYHAAIGSGAVTLIRELDSHDRLSRDELGKIEAVKLDALLAHAKRTVPYFRNLIPQGSVETGSRQGRELFQSIPLLTKDIIRKRKQDLVSETPGNNRLDPNSTSGSKGEPLYFYTDLRSKSYRKAVVARNRKWVGILTGDPVARLWGANIDMSRAHSIRGQLHGLITRELFLSAYDLDDEHMESYARRINDHKARLLIGYPSVLQKFGRFCNERGVEFPALKAIICSAEVLLPSHRDSIERDLSAPVFNRYGCREVGDIAQEIPGQEGLVVNSDRIHVEILDESGEPCSPGEVGDIVITDLDNYGMPLIRYRIGDRGSWAAAASSSNGMPYPILENVEGRSLDVVICPSGNRIGGTFWTILMRGRPGIEGFRVIQHSIDSLTIEYKRLPDVTNIDTDYFRKKIVEQCGEDMQVKFEEKTSIEAPLGEKFRLVKSEIASTN